MRTRLKTRRGYFELPGWVAKFLWLSHKTTVPLALGFGLYGLIAGMLQNKLDVAVAGAVAMLTGWILKSYVEYVFERYGRPAE